MALGCFHIGCPYRGMNTTYFTSEYMTINQWNVSNNNAGVNMAALTR